MNTIKCPMCQKPQPQHGSDAIYYCPNCEMQFDTRDPDDDDLDDDDEDYTQHDDADAM